MSKFKDPSVSDSFNAPGKGPHNPSDINWKYVGVVAAIVFAGVGIFGLIIHLSHNGIANQFMAHNMAVMKKWQESSPTQAERLQATVPKEEPRSQTPASVTPEKTT